MRANLGADLVAEDSCGREQKEGSAGLLESKPVLSFCL